MGLPVGRHQLYDWSFESGRLFVKTDSEIIAISRQDFRDDTFHRQVDIISDTGSQYVEVEPDGTLTVVLPVQAATAIKRLLGII